MDSSSAPESVDFDAYRIFARARKEGDPQVIIDALPYAIFLGMSATVDEGQYIYCLQPKPTNIGNPVLPALHGGAIGGFMEMAAAIHLLMTLDTSRFESEQPGSQTPIFPKIVDFSVDYVRACRCEDTFAACSVVRQGRKLANVAVNLWQSDKDNPAATARVHFLLSAESVAAKT